MPSSGSTRTRIGSITRPGRSPIRRRWKRSTAGYPEDREAAAFYALALLATAKSNDKTRANQLQAAAILEPIFAERPNHPGAAHYLIHAYDSPDMAPRGLPAARRYSQIAPSAPHALHMPSHIFTRLGFWEDSIELNRASAAAATAETDRLHAMDYLAYASLQGARDGEAKRAMDQVAALGEITAANLGTAYALAAIPARYAIERHRWAEAASLAPYPADFPWGRFPQGEAITAFARALGAARGGNPAAAHREHARLHSLQEALIGAKQGNWAEQADIQRQVIGAWIARAEGKTQKALQFMRAAADLEDTTETHPVTPGPIAPARELLGEMLLDAGQPGEALKTFEAVLPKTPNRFNALYGAARAAQFAGHRHKARTYYEQRLATCPHADTAGPEVTEAKAFLATK